jgi:hypothetical protein
MKDAQPDWRHLSDILQELTSFDHRFRQTFEAMGIQLFAVFTGGQFVEDTNAVEAVKDRR